MKRITLLAIAAGAIFGSVGAASAQGIYLDLGPDRGPRPYYRDYDDGPRYRDRERYRGERYGDRRDRGYYRPGGYKTFNGCQNGWTVQDGLCKPYRGYGPPALRAARWRCLPTLQSQDSDREALGSHVRQHRAAVTSCSARCGRPGARSP
jgi:hypothetical protein